jgi:DNA polymerase-1
LFGRKRRLYFERESGSWGIRASGERKAKNAPIQGSSADMIKKAALTLDKLIRDNHWPYIPLLSIHDELIFEVPIAWLNEHRDTLDQMKYAMEHCVELKVPLKVSMDILNRWGEKRLDEADTLDIEDEEPEEEEAA